MLGDQDGGQCGSGRESRAAVGKDRSARIWGSVPGEPIALSLNIVSSLLASELSTAMCSGRWGLARDRECGVERGAEGKVWRGPC